MFKNKYTVFILIMTIVISLSIFYSVNRKHQDSLLIFTAVSLSEPMTEVKSLFENKYGIKILLNLNGSQSLASQISRGAHPDIFISAGNTPYDFLISNQIDIHKKKLLVLNTLVFATEIDLYNLDQNRLKNIILDPKFNRISIADPELAPAGEYSMQAINNSIGFKNVENKIIKTKNVRDAVNHLRLGLSEAVFAYITDFNTYPNKIYKKNISSILHDQIEYPIIYLNSNDNVKKFEEYLYTDEAKNIFINYGFKIPQD
tara:strand:+ start:282 stop:1058 length:777 start_codon:yes stop_codon:yes gene_type:complete